MKRRYKLLLIILIGCLITILISSLKTISKTSVTSLGDSLALGLTSYYTIGESFNDYLKEELKQDNNLDDYNTEFCLNNLTISILNDYIEDNKYASISNLPIKQIIAKSDILIIAIGMDELTKYNIVNDEVINNYLNEINKLLTNIRKFYHKQIILLGIYPYLNLTKNDTLKINSNLQSITDKYNAYFLDILAYSLNSEYYFDNSSYYLNYKAHKLIENDLYLMINHSR